MTKLPVLLLLLTVADVAPKPEHFRYQRPIEGLQAGGGQTCVVLDPALYAHAAPQLADLRLYSDGVETPYALRSASISSVAKTQAFEPLNKGLRHGRTSFDAEIADMHYSDVELEIAAKDFIATVAVSGSRDRDGESATKLGSYTIFDLSRQRLGRSTVLHLPVSELRYLHFEISGPVQPDEVTGVQVTQQRVAAPTYTTVAATAQIERKGKNSIAVFMLPANVPVDRIVFEPGAQPAQFNRAVSVEASSAAPPTGSQVALYTSVSVGKLLRVHSVEGGHRIDAEQLTVDAPSVSGEGAMRWTVAIDNGDDAPLAIRQIRLEILERKLCFKATPGASYTLFYGDAALVAPRYDYASLFDERGDAARAALGQEQANPAFKPRPDMRPFTEKHPALLWIALVVAVVLLGLIALRSAPMRKKD